MKWMNDNNSELAPMSRSKFYVALTRAKFSVGIVYDYNDDTRMDGIKKVCCFLIKGLLYITTLVLHLQNDHVNELIMSLSR